MVRRVALVASLVVVLAFVLAAQSATPLAPPTAASLAADDARLAAPEMEGRGSATPGGDRAAHTIAGWLEAAGLRPGGDAGTFFQSFAVSSGIVVARASTLDIVAPGAHHFDIDRDWRPHGGSLTTELSAEVVFVAHGIVSADGRHDDYRDVDVKGKIALALDGAPGGFGASAPSRPAKAVAARRHGAAALLLVQDRLASADATKTAARIVSAAVTRATADALLARSGHTVAALERTRADGARRRAFATGTTARITVVLGHRDRLADNVVGVLPGTDPALAGEAVVIGAHYDHLGVVDGAIHPGADDNASGTAAVVGLARSFAAAGGTPRTLVFALFGAEEVGLLGSRHYVANPTVPLERTAAMVNLDMVGRMRDRRLIVGGVDSGRGLRDLVSEAARAAGVTAELDGAPYAPSDHVRFYRRGTPVLFLHTGPHGDYHQPSDTADRINADGLARAAHAALRVVDALARAPRPAYAMVLPRREQSGHGGTFLGVVVEAPDADGVPLADVVPAGPAARAGLREGDTLVEFANAPLGNFEDLRAALKELNPGDVVRVVYLREGEDHTTSITVDARP